MTDTDRTTQTSLTVTIDGQTVEAQAGELIIDAAERAGVFIPRFCYHPHMEPVGMCRMCLVEVSGPRGFGLQPACYIRVADGQEIRTASERARKAQEGVIEFLLINHPLDCPVCDKGGECPLQDQSLSHGPGESRFIEEKRHWAKPIDIGPLVALDRERCIQCARCTRFAEEVAGDALIDFAFRGDHIEVATFPDKPFDSYFAGNTVQICPVGALTARPYRFKSRPWDLEQVESTCTTCSVGCRVAAQSSAGALVRFLGVDSLPVNQSWLCDKGRFSHETVYADSRLTEPFVRNGETTETVRWPEALRRSAVALRAAIDDGPGRIGVIGGSRFSNEDAYAWAKFAKSVLRTDSVDAQLDDGLPADVVLGLPRATIDDAVNARLVILLAADLREELPVLYLRLREAAVKAGREIIECSPAGSALSAHVSVQLGYLPGEAALLASALLAEGEPNELVSVGRDELAAARELLGAARATAGDEGDGGIVVVLGRPSLAESGATIASAATILTMLPGVKFLSALRRANVHGAIDMGLAPGVLPGRVSLEAGRGWFGDLWGELPAARGEDTAAILARAARGELSALVLLGADPVADFPDRSLAEEALRATPFVLSLATHHDRSNALAHVVLPVPADGERAGTTTNLEGRVTSLAAKVVPPGVARPPWMVARELASRLDADLGIENLDSLTDEIGRSAPAYRGITAESFSSGAWRDGAIIPLRAGESESDRPLPFDPIATPGIASVDEQGAPLRVGFGVPLGGGDVGAPSTTAPLPQPIGLASGDPVVAGRLDAYSHRLVIGRTLYDGGTLVSSSSSLADLASAPRFRLHPSEMARLGLVDDDQLRVRSARGEATAPVRADERVARGVVVLAHNPAAADVIPAALVDASQLATDVRIETV
jgi:NADH-quinone oxidoreductase subunit G